MERIRGHLQKMKARAEAPVAYSLHLGEHELPLNSFLGQTVSIEWLGEISCIACGQQVRKSFNQGYCYSCFRTLARCDLCVVKPELCHYAQGTCREPSWGLANCMQPHYVYLANSSGLKVGITRASQIPVRWLDQGAVQALPVFRVHSRYEAGLLEVALKQYVADRTEWRRMLRGEPEFHDLPAHRDALLVRCGKVLSSSSDSSESTVTAPVDGAIVQTFRYPIIAYPSRVVALHLEKTTKIEGTLLGIKGQYLMFDTGVLNVRKFTGYAVSVSIGAG